MSHATSHPQPTTSSPSPNLHAACSPLRKRSAFTLIELLVVIAIIVVLAGLGFAGLQGAIESGKKAQARNDVTQLAAAVKAYQLEYGRLPEEAEIIASLTGENTKELVFFEAKTAKGNPPKGGILNDKLYDPWGQEYIIELDDDYDNRVSHNGVEHLTTVVVETTPPGSNQKPINNVQ
jgi:prepilin-type N-terminal cleavage/methylation domain-containing protein